MLGTNLGSGRKQTSMKTISYLSLGNIESSQETGHVLTSLVVGDG